MRIEEDGEPYQQLRNFEALVACPKWYRFLYDNSGLPVSLKALSPHSTVTRTDLDANTCQPTYIS